MFMDFNKQLLVNNSGSGVLFFTVSASSGNCNGEVYFNLDFIVE